jgi:Kef-type K+ transport system membrane component KefB
VFVPVLLLVALGGLMEAAGSFASDEGASTLLAFGYLMLSSFFMGKIADRLGLPKLTGYLIVGMLAGPFVLGFVDEHATASLKFVSDTAICLIALTAGSELNFRRIRPVMPTLRAMTLYAVVGAMIVLSTVLFLARPLIPFLSDMTTPQALAVCGVIGVALSAQSPAVVMALLAETRADGPLSQVILGSVVVADLVVIVMYAVTATIASSVLGAGMDVLDTAISVSWELFGSIAFGFAMGATLGTFLRLVKRGAAMFTVLICVVVAEIGARVHLDPLIVMLAAGIWLENLSRANAHDLLREIESARLPLFLVFFSLAGSHIDLGQLARSIAPVAILVIARVISFRFGTAVACRVSGAAPVVTKYAWFGLVPQSGLAIALALLVRQTFPSFGDAAAVLTFGVVATNELVAPVILRRMILRSGEAGKKTIADLTLASH